MQSIISNSLTECACPVEAFADQLKALGHPVRLKLVRHLLANQDCCCGELCACFNHTQSTVSQHLGVLKDAGLVKNERRGNRMHYTVEHEAMKLLCEQLSSLTGASMQTPDLGPKHEDRNS